MKYGVTVPPFEDLFQPRTLAAWARAAEDAGWNGFFVWDHVSIWPTITLDHLSGGRLTLGVGSGSGPWECDYLGEEPDQGIRAAMLEEHLELLTRFWTGEPVLHDGRFYKFRGRGQWRRCSTVSAAGPPVV